MARPNNWEDESYNNIKEDNRPYMDPYLKDMIEKAFKIFDTLVPKFEPIIIEYF